MLSGICPASFGVLFTCVVLGCQYTPQNTGPCRLLDLFSNWGLCLSVTLLIVDLLQYCSCCIRSGVTPDAPSQWCSTWSVCASAVYTRCAMVTHRYTYALLRCRTMQYRKTFNPLSVSLWNNLADPLFDAVGRWQVSRAVLIFFFVGHTIENRASKIRAVFYGVGLAGFKSRAIF